MPDSGHWRSHIPPHLPPHPHREDTVRWPLPVLTSRSSLVVATGGGAVTQPDNRKFLNQRGIVIYLYTPVELQLQRTYRDKNRPLLQVDDPEQKLRDLLSARDPLYREIAHYIIETNQGAARELAQKILQLISSQQVT